MRPKHAGNYTIVLSNPKYGLHKNLTMQLVVTGKDWVIYPILCDPIVPASRNG